MESMPRMDQLGTEYTSFPPHFGGDGGYEVRIIAAHDDTDVTVPAFQTSLTLDSGDFHVIDNPETGAALWMTCSKPCMAVQYLRSLPQGGQADEYLAAFLAVLTPDVMSSSDLVFTVPRTRDNPYFRAGLSLIVNTFPITDLFLNDTSLADLDWQSVEGSGNWFATLEIEHGLYRLYSSVPTER